MRCLARATDVRTRTAFRLVVLSFCFLLQPACRFAPEFDKVGGTKLTYTLAPDQDGLDVDMAEKAMTRRLDPNGFVGVKVHVENGKMEISVPNGKYHDLEIIERLATAVGDLKFMIVADDTDDEIAQAAAAATAEMSRELLSDGKIVAVWYPIATNESGEAMAQFEQTNLQRSRDDRTEVALKASASDVQGKHLKTVLKGYDDAKRPTLNFSLTSVGADRMQALSKANIGRRLAIVFDEQVISAPQIHSEISQQGQITGSFSEDWIEEMVVILTAGEMPFELTTDPPIKEEVAPSK